jgi:hypothetical protein
MNTNPTLVERIRGMDERSRPANPGAVLQLRDLTWDPQDVWTDSGGSRLLIAQGEANPYIGEGKITSIHHFTQRTGGKNWLLYETSTGRLRAFNGSGRSGTPWYNLIYRDGTTISDRAYLTSPWPGTMSAAWGDRLYLVNGINKPVVFDGEMVDYMGWDTVPSPPEGNAGTPVTNFLRGYGAAGSAPAPGDGVAQVPYALAYMGLGPYDTTTTANNGVDFDCAYRYKQSWVNDRGQESPLSEASSTVLFTNKHGQAAGSGSKIISVSLGTGPMPTAARRIYRTQNLKDSSGNFVQGRGEQFFFLCEINDNLMTAFEDGIDDSLLGSLVDETALGLVPDGARHIAPFAGRMFAAGISTTQIYHSAPGYPEVFPPNNVVNIGDAHLGPITGMYPTRDALVVCKLRGMYLVKIDSAGNFYVVTLSREYGCSSPKSIVDVPNVGLCFVGGSDIFALTGTLESTNTATGVERISTPIPTQMGRLNRSALLNACATVIHREKEVWFALPTIGQATNRRVLVYHYEVGSWSFRDDFPIMCMLTTADERGYLIYGSHDDTSAPGIYVYSRGWNDKNGTAIAPLLQTWHMDLGKMGIRTTNPRKFTLRCGGHGNNNLSVNYTFNGQPLNIWTTTEASDGQKPAQLPQTPFAVYGTATYTTSGTTRATDGTYSVWSPVRVITQRWPISQPENGPILDISVTVTPVDRHVTFEGFAIEETNLKGEPIDTASGSGTR